MTTISKYIGTGLILSSMLWVGLLITVADHVRAEDHYQYAVNVGPWVLDHVITRHASSGSTISITFESGLIWYILTWVIVSGIIGYIRSNRKHT